MLRMIERNEKGEVIGYKCSCCQKMFEGKDKREEWEIHLVRGCKYKEEYKSIESKQKELDDIHNKQEVKN